MKILKKIMAGIIASMTCLGMVTSSVSAVASSYKIGDVDGDGSVTLSDLATMNQFLNGLFSANARTTERLDLNTDYVIDSRDKDILSLMLVNSNIPGTNDYENTAGLPEQNSDGEDYYIYSPSTGAFEDSYHLEPLDSISTNSYGASTYSIIGTDDRTASNDLYGVLNVQYSDGTNAGTAFVVDSHTIITAAHVLYGTRGIKTGLKFKVFLDYDSEMSLPNIQAVEYHIPAYFINNAYTGLPLNTTTVNSDARKYDYAIIKTRFALPNYCTNFNVGILRDEIPLNSDVYVTGFGSTGNNVNPQWVDVRTTGHDHFQSVTSNMLYYYTDMVPGNSGSPVYLYDATNNTRTVIGINTMQYSNVNFGVRITTDILHFIYNNDYLD